MAQVCYFGVDVVPSNELQENMGVQLGTEAYGILELALLFLSVIFQRSTQVDMSKACE